VGLGGFLRPISPRSCLRHRTKVPTLSTESIASSTLPIGAADACAACGAPLAADQRYCLECGERRAATSSVLLAGPPTRAEAPPAPPASAPPRVPGGAGTEQRSSTLMVIAGVGVLLLAMGVGVLIGRSGSSKQVAALPQVISVSGAPGAATSAGATATPFTDDWPSGTSGYTVQLQTLPESGTQVTAVQAAKASASAKGAAGVGALKSEDFSSLTAGSYVIYSGVFHTKAAAEKALGGLKASFPGASVIHVSNSGSGSSSGGGSSSSAGGSGAGSNESHPAPPTVLNNLRKGGGKSYEQKSKNLPDVIETG
jgi:hypothetical protein